MQTTNFKISLIVGFGSFYDGDYEECRILACGALLVYYKPMRSSETSVYLVTFCTTQGIAWFKAKQFKNLHTKGQRFV
jgi:hypothetical protein